VPGVSRGRPTAQVVQRPSRPEDLAAHAARKCRRAGALRCSGGISTCDTRRGGRPQGSEARCVDGWVDEALTEADELLGGHSTLAVAAGATREGGRGLRARDRRCSNQVDEV
jgi:hypothetical protein